MKSRTVCRQVPPRSRAPVPSMFVVVAAAFGWATTACASDDPFEPAPPFHDKEDVQVWATSASALGVYMNGYEPIAVADGQASYRDPECPVTSDDGTTLTVSGGCTDSEDRDFSGRATVVRDGDDRTLTLDDFNGGSGTVSLRLVSALLHEFDVELVLGGVTTIDYSGTIDGDYAGPSIWNGSGTVRRKGFPPTGVVEANTSDEVVNDAICSGQPVSGSTTLRARGDTAVVTYDGATDCDDAQNAKLSVNGKDRGSVSGIMCSVGELGRRGAPGLPNAVLGIVLFALFGRRRAPSRSAR